MIVSLVVIRENDGDDPVHWVHTARDQSTIDDEPGSWEAALLQLRNDYGAQNVRVVRVKVVNYCLSDFFRVPTVEGEVVGK
jgi:hypothetical protein